MTEMQTDWSVSFLRRPRVAMWTLLMLCGLAFSSCATKPPLGADSLAPCYRAIVTEDQARLLVGVLKFDIRPGSFIVEPTCATSDIVRLVNEIHRLNHHTPTTP